MPGQLTKHLLVLALICKKHICKAFLLSCYILCGRRHAKLLTVMYKDFNLLTRYVILLLFLIMFHFCYIGLDGSIGVGFGASSACS